MILGDVIDVLPLGCHYIEQRQIVGYEDASPLFESVAPGYRGDR